MTEQPPTVLIVDDSPEDRAVLRRMLNDAAPSAPVREAGMGAEALRICEEDPPSCVLLDYRLPDMDGSEFLGELRERGLHVPVAVVTGQEDPRLAARAFAEGAEDYIVKGTVTAAGLYRAIGNSIEKSRIRRELETKTASLELRHFELQMVRDELQSRLLELSEATRAKDQFLALMSHEMRTPLNAIIGYADLLEAGIGGEMTDSQYQFMERIRVGGRHLLDLINDVLDLARADARRLDLELQAVDLGAILEEVTALLESQAAVKQIALTLELEPDLPHVHGDLQRLRQVFTNVIGNAIKFTDEGSVAVSARAGDEGTIVIEVKDTGIGISPDVLPLIFTEFFQADGRYTREQGGSGLGLAIAQRLVRLMGGRIEAGSEPGAGSVFTITLAQAAGEAAAPADDALEVVAADELLPRAEDGVCVVAFAEDRSALAELERQVLPGVRLVWTTDPDAVTRIAQEQKAALVVLDVSAPEGVSWRIAHALPDVPELADTAVLLLPYMPAASGEGRRGLDLGWVALVPKPFTAHQLTNAVERAARGVTAEAADIDVLVVDDDDDSRRVASQFLKQVGANVREARDGESALGEMRRRPPDVVVLDLMMPVLDGFGVLATMRVDPLLVDVPVVVLSAKTLSEAERRFLARTAARVLQKGEHRLSDVASLVIRAAHNPHGVSRG